MKSQSLVVHQAAYPGLSNNSSIFLLLLFGFLSFRNDLISDGVGSDPVRSSNVLRRNSSSEQIDDGTIPNLFNLLIINSSIFVRLIIFGKFSPVKSDMGLMTGIG